MRVSHSKEHLELLLSYADLGLSAPFLLQVDMHPKNKIAQESLKG